MIKDYVSFFRRRFPSDLRSRLPRAIGVASVSVARSRALNLTYRGRAKATNVLSFRYGDEYGEIVLCPRVIRREAGRSKENAGFRTAWMILHGMIHLAGVHHESSRTADRKTVRLEAELIGALLGSRRVPAPRDGWRAASK